MALIAVLSPAKNICPARAAGVSLTRPVFLRRAAELAGSLRRLAPWELESLLRINPDLALRAAAAFQAFDEAAPGSPALLAYRGLAYQKLNAADFTGEDLLFAQDHLRILSAFYGVLRPLDGILPHRLEFQCGYRPGGRPLYHYWGGVIREALAQENGVPVNLASAEYARAAFPRGVPPCPGVTCDFRTYRRGRWVTGATYAKMARGLMARYIVKNRLSDPEDLKFFAEGGWAYSPALSSGGELVFLLREECAPCAAGVLEKSNGGIHL